MGYAELLETLQNLPQDKQIEVFDFVEFLAAKSAKLAPSTMAQAKLHEYQQTLASFEQKYAMTTAAFQHAFNAGELGDAPEWFDWDSYAALATEAQRQISHHAN